MLSNRINDSKKPLFKIQSLGELQPNASLKITPLALIIASLAACGGGNEGGAGNNSEPAAPEFTSATSATVDDNINGAIYSATATDVNNDALTFAINGGADQAAFSIDAASGELSLTRSVDFEAPADANTDNVYEVSLSVDDGSDQLALTLTVEDVTQLALQVSYPTPNANLGDGVAFTSVTGFVEDLEDGEVQESDIDFISVNGQGADIELPVGQGSTPDNPLRWRTQLPVTTVPNSNTLNIELLDNSNNSQQISQQLLNRLSLRDLVDTALDCANNRALVLDARGAMTVIDLGSG